MPKNDLHILHVSSPKSWRGGERQLSFLVEELAKMEVAQTVLCAQGSKLAEWCRQHRVRHFTYRKIFPVNPLVAWRIRQLCRRQKITHLHTHDSHSHTFAVLAASWFGNRVPVVAHRRTDFPIGGSFLSKWKYNHHSVYRIVCVSAFIKKLIGPALREPQRAVVVHDGIDLEGVLEKTAPPEPRPTKYTIGNIAAIAPHKDYFTFVRTAEVLLAAGLPAKFLLIGGDGGEWAAIRDFISEKKLGEHLEMLGFRTDVPQLLAQLDLLLFTSKTEGLGSSILDAMAARVPVVATAAGGIPEIVEHEATGLLAPVGDAAALAQQVQRMLSDSSFREKTVANARHRVRSFSKQKMAERILGIYKS